MQKRSQTFTDGPGNAFKTLRNGLAEARKHSKTPERTDHGKRLQNACKTRGTLENAQKRSGLQNVQFGRGSNDDGLGEARTQKRSGKPLKRPEMDRLENARDGPGAVPLKGVWECLRPWECLGKPLGPSRLRDAEACGF